MSRAAIQTAINAPVEIHEMLIRDIYPGQVRVRISMAGICGAQLQELRGEKGSEYIPHLLGHEGVGNVIEVSEGVKLKVGQRVCLHWREGCGCNARPAQYYAADESFEAAGGPVHTWAERVSVSENRCTPIPDDVPDEIACLFGCAASTALGVCENEATLRMGESVLVVGCGGVGLCCIAAAKAMGCEVDCFDKNPEKEELALKIGARRFHLPEVKNTNPLNAPFDCVIDTTGSRKAISLCSVHLAKGGRMILVGQTPPCEPLELFNGRSFIEGAKTLIATQGGACNPSQDIPRWIRAWRSGHLKLDGIVTHRFPLAQVNEALDLLRSGSAGRIMLTMD